MNLSMLKNKNTAFLGLGIENLALIKYLLQKKVQCTMTVCDFKSAESLGENHKELIQYQNINWQLGDNANHGLDSFDVIFRSPGWPLFDRGVVEAKKAGVTITSAMELFLELCQTPNTIGVTGTKGKGTTSSLIYQILLTNKKRAWIAGNIGVAPFSFREKIKKTDWVVLELSSFQLQDLKFSPHIAVLTNFVPEHLAPADPHNPNHHSSLSEYWQAKINIVRSQKIDDIFVINQKLKNKTSRLKLKGKIFYFTKSELLSQLPGEHNKENIAAAVEVAKLVGVNNEIIIKAIKSFSGLEHRIEFVGKFRGTSYYDDSFATTPESAIIALESFSAPIILLAGGADKGSDFKKLASEIKRRVRFLILFKGEATPRLKKEVVQVKFPENNIRVVDSMSEAVQLAKQQAESGDIVLMSPACASFGMFQNYKQRGNLFKQAARSPRKTETLNTI